MVTEHSHKPISFTYFRQFKRFVKTGGYHYNAKPREVPYGFLVRITDGATNATVTFYHNGTVQIQGKEGELKAAVTDWRDTVILQSKRVYE